MLLITSGAYVESELASEFGRIPPAFLPVGNRRLYTYQIKQFRRLHEHVCLTLPDDFLPDEADALYLREHGVSVFHTTPGAPLHRPPEVAEGGSRRPAACAEMPARGQVGPAQPIPRTHWRYSTEC